MSNEPFPAILYCPGCWCRHYDEGAQPHRRHECAHCRFRWTLEPFCYGAHSCDWPDCINAGVNPRHLIGGGEVHLCAAHEAEGEQRGQWVPSEGRAAP